jgi:hypothetical protein
MARGGVATRPRGCCAGKKAVAPTNSRQRRKIVRTLIMMLEAVVDAIQAMLIRGVD